MADEALRKKRVAVQLGRWAIELLLVFAGVYGAFSLSNYQQNQQDAKRRDQILASLERQLQQGIDSMRSQGVRAEANVAEFGRALAAGEMPLLVPFDFAPDYNPSDMATLLQSGGIALLDPNTLDALRYLESVMRGGLSRSAHYERWSDELIAPNLDQDISFFYDPATKQLRKRFQKYPAMLETVRNLFRDVEAAQTNLLAQIRAERAKAKR
jgi:hypothetical protein